MKTHLIRNREELTDWFTKLHIVKKDFYPITLQVFKGDKKHRNLSQNDLSHVWYREIAQQAEDRTPHEVKRECKLNYGVPILMADEHFREIYNKVVADHDYVTRLRMMDYLPVTSAMSVPQMTEYLETIHYTYTEAGYHIDVPQVTMIGEQDDKV